MPCLLVALVAGAQEMARERDAELQMVRASEAEARTEVEKARSANTQVAPGSESALWAQYAGLLPPWCMLGWHRQPWSRFLMGRLHAFLQLLAAVDNGCLSAVSPS
jgi:hypothetical protein